MLLLRIFDEHLDLDLFSSHIETCASHANITTATYQWHLSLSKFLFKESLKVLLNVYNQIFIDSLIYFIVSLCILWAQKIICFINPLVQIVYAFLLRNEKFLVYLFDL